MFFGTGSSDIVTFDCMLNNWMPLFPIEITVTQPVNPEPRATQLSF